MYFTDGPLRVYEQEMRHPPYEKRPGGGSYTFLSAPAPSLLSSHTQATKLSYRQLVSDRFRDLERSPLGRRIEALTAGAAGLRYSGTGHLERIRACQPTDGPVPPEQPEHKWVRHPLSPRRAWTAVVPNSPSRHPECSGLHQSRPAWSGNARLRPLSGGKEHLFPPFKNHCR